MSIFPLRRVSLFSALAVGLSLPALADAPVISDKDAKSHVGETAKVEGTVTKVSEGKSGSEFLNFGDAFPNQTFTVMIPADSKKAFGDLKRFEGQKVAVSGQIRTYRTKPEIVLDKPDQLQPAP
jgi:DNA/RNA endonuclease YhcR with UshA esterase domain